MLLTITSLLYETDTDLSIVLMTMSLISAHSATVFTRRSCRYDHSVFSVLRNTNMFTDIRIARLPTVTSC